ncbi:hypothetical protein P175DRAFT_0503240 [Aspergillus ochraceoroseus IBT 24754]|uniref:DUF4396 domain-containing protein n=1 Tax=Aspergillus ochraceoroseus IBT 24754 TaxID=1392256 RepID=A0A2T5LTV0_9EURO|nr:uncharacterized protein P175DRAFT_0503240 [Aspergillus ochraceoroseus IBT 24754]PTU19710.1 hypothetical protein P175DRAFT_0503240 [Aspergillus ochraceoroseus IBT 24754]
MFRSLHLPASPQVLGSVFFLPRASLRRSLPFARIQACYMYHGLNVCSITRSYSQRCNSSRQTGSLLSPVRLAFWTCRSTWRRAGINTLRCLVGCTAGDFSALWMLQTYLPDIGMGSIMALSMVSGITTSIFLETILLRHGVDKLSWPVAVRTAMGMSLVSMLAMETVENLVDYHLTGGVIALQEPRFWLAAALSIGAGFLAPLPYNYLRLRKYGKACH